MKNIRKRISNKTKVIFVKGFILFTFSWMIFFFVVGFRFECGLTPEWFFWVVFLIYVLLGVIMVYLMSKVDIEPTRAEPVIKLVSMKEYGQFRQALFDRAIKDGFGNIRTIDIDENAETTWGFQPIKDGVNVLQTIWMQDFDPDLVDNVTELCYEETGKVVGKDKLEYMGAGLIQCVCVRRMNKEFRKFITQNVRQDYKRYQIIIGISFGGRKAYICQTKGGFYRRYYRYLKKMFDKLTDGILIEKDSGKN